jgi:phosphoglycerate dehydrogenase-like enzyme
MNMGVLLMYLEPEELTRDQVDAVQALVPDLRVVVTRDRSQIEGMLDDIEIAAGHVPTELVPRMPKLRWFQQWGAGADWLLRHPEAVEMDFVLTNASGVHPIQISEHIIGMLLMFARALHHAVRAQTRREWWRGTTADVFELAEKTMLLVGVGAIGERTALLAEALGMRVEGIRNNASQNVAHVAAMYGPDQLRERLPHADVVVLTVPLSQSTRNMIGANELRAMKPTAYLINIGRGGTINETALVQALREGWIAGAGLDVCEEEPLPPESPLWDMEQVIITAHYAGMTPRYNERAMAIFLDNLRRFRDGAPLRNQVDKQAGY